MAISKKGMADMKRSPMTEKPSLGLVNPSRDTYGYGTAVTLDADALKKLGIKELPEVGDEYHIVAVGKVTSTAKNASENNESTRVEIQLTHMDLTHEDAAEEAKETPAEEKREMYKLGGGRFK
jgi:hypothetical protein